MSPLLSTVRLCTPSLYARVKPYVGSSPYFIFLTSDQRHHAAPHRQSGRRHHSPLRTPPPLLHVCTYAPLTLHRDLLSVLTLPHTAEIAVALVSLLQYGLVVRVLTSSSYPAAPTSLLRLNDKPPFLPVPFLPTERGHNKWKSTDDGSEKENDEPLSSKTFLLEENYTQDHTTGQDQAVIIFCAPN